jgi:hypothetical protein
MTAASTRLSYLDAYEALDRAKDDSKGIRVKFSSISEAQTFRARLNYARVIDRRDNCSIYTENDPLYGRSVYDPLMARIRQDTEGGWWVYIEHTNLEERVVESLGEIEDAAE